MSTLKIGTYGNQTQFRPGDEIAGKVLWLLDRPAEQVEVRLFWYTEGKGTQDVEVVATCRVDASQPRGESEFRFAAPNGPYSFSGRLISLLWALEAVAPPSKDVDRLPITLSPTGQEILLLHDAEPDRADEGPEQSVSD